MDVPAPKVSEPAQTDEQTAILSLKAGDIAGLHTLVDLYQVRAVRASYLICRDLMLAEDIVQAAFLRAFERIGQFNSNRAFGPWLLRSVVNDTLAAVTRRKSIPFSEMPEFTTSDVAGGPNPQELIEAAETREALWEALAQLSPEQRAAVVLRYYLDLGDREISERLDVPPGTVRRRLHDARKRLRSLLPEWIGTGKNG